MPIVTTLAGNGTFGYADGTGGPNGSAEFYQPQSIATDAQGNVYVADSGNYRIRKIDALGNVTTFADGIYPSGVAVDALGNIFIAGDNCIYEIDVLGNMTTYAGNGAYGDVDGTGGPHGTAEFQGPAGIAVDANGNIFVTDSQNFKVRKIDTNGNVTTLAGNGHSGYVDGTSGPNGTAEFGTLAGGLVVDSQDNVFVADTYNNCIRKIDALGNVTTYAGNGTQGFSDGTGGPHGTAEFDWPTGITADAQGNLFIADSGNARIRKIDVLGNVITLAGNGTVGYVDGTGGPNGTAEFQNPTGVGVDNQDNIFIADEVSSRIREIDPLGNVTTYAGNGTHGYSDGTGGPNGSAEFNLPIGVATDAQGNVYVTDTNNSRIRKIDINGDVTTLAGNGSRGYQDGTGGPNGTAEFHAPTGIAVDALGNVFVADTVDNCIRKIDTLGNVTTYAGNGTTGGAGFNVPQGIAIDAQGNVFVADTFNSRVCKIDVLGNVTTLAVGPNGISEFNSPQGVAVDAQGNVFVADTGNSRICEIDTTGNVTALAGNCGAGFRFPQGVAVDTQGNVFATYVNNRVCEIEMNGSATTLAGNGTSGYQDGTGGPNGTAEFNTPRGIAADALSNVYVADSNNNRIRKISP